VNKSDIIVASLFFDQRNLVACSLWLPGCLRVFASSLSASHSIFPFQCIVLSLFLEAIIKAQYNQYSVHISSRSHTKQTYFSSRYVHTYNTYIYMHTGCPVKILVCKEIGEVVIDLSSAILFYLATITVTILIVIILKFFKRIILKKGLNQWAIFKT